MPDDDKTEQPTEKKLSEARSEGQIARAPELQVVAGLLGSFSVILFAGKNIAMEVMHMWESIFGHLHELQATPQQVAAWAKVGAASLLGLTMPILTTSATVSVLVGFLQTNFAFTPNALGMKWNRLDPIAGMQRIFSKDGLVRLGIDTMKLSIVGSLIYTGVKGIISDPIFTSEVQPHQLGSFMYDTSLALLYRFSLGLGGIATLNFLYQKFKINKDLMMTRQEVKDEMKNSEGDPLMKAMRRQMARRLVQKQMLAKIPTADVVITNPTHYAVALKYERGVDQAPIVLAKGENAFALRIKALAATHGVPTVENRPVARMLYKFGKVGESIPAQLFHAVAEILGFVYRTHRLYFHELKQRRLKS